MSLFVGLMSGTSIDAIDAVLVEANQATFQVIATYTHPWPQALRNILLELSLYKQSNSTLHELALLDRMVGKEFASATLALLAQQQLASTEITAIGCSGQTIYHSPDTTPAYTYQIGDPNTLAEFTGITTVADFRRRDIAAGGQGAPLATAFHQAMMHSSQENRVVLNIGGIANITVLPADATLPIIGFDTGPGNTLLDAWIQDILHLPFDKQGKWANSGQVNDKLLTILLADLYFSRPAPKTTGRDYFNIPWLKSHLTHFNLSPEDVQATLAQLTVQSSVQAILPYSPNHLFVCGGGVHNSVLMRGLQSNLPHCIVQSTEAIGIDPDWVEAACFAWLAKQRLAEQPSNLPSVTGARHSVSLGCIYHHA